jgi:RNA polymerase sigma-70 factor (ECF subfamily)
MPEMLLGIEELIDSASRGDEAAQHILLERFRDDLRRMVAARLDRRVAARVDPSDVVQETLIEADRRFEEYLRERPIPFLAWLRQIAANRIMENHRLHIAVRKRSVTFEATGGALPDESGFALAQLEIADGSTPSDRLIRQEKQEQIRRAVASLPPKDREVLVMRHLEQLSSAEIAGVLGISEGAVKARLVRALVRLQGEFGAES